VSGEPQLDYDVVSLAELKAYPDLLEHVKQKLASFRCARSTHLQAFANEDVWRWEAHGHLRTYVFLSPGDEDDIVVPAFFSVSMTTLDFGRATRSKSKQLMGNISMETTGAFSIVELARCDTFTHEELPGPVILREALDVIEKAREHIGGRFVVVDSQAEVFERLYKAEGFKRVSLAKAPRGMEGANFVTSARLLKDAPTE
jgi:hypothetical protein